MGPRGAARLGVPLYRALAATTPPAPLPAYASNLNPDGAPDTSRLCRERGYRAFKMKVAFDLQRDLDNVRRHLRALRPANASMIDANQGWDLRPQRRRSRVQPLPAGVDRRRTICADDPPEHWPRWPCCRGCRSPDGRTCSVSPPSTTQSPSAISASSSPNLCKWGGMSAARPWRPCVAAGRRYCRTGELGVGLHAAADLLAGLVVAACRA